MVSGAMKLSEFPTSEGLPDLVESVGGFRSAQKTRRSDVSERLLFHQLAIIWLLVYLNLGVETSGLTWSVETAFFD